MNMRLSRTVASFRPASAMVVVALAVAALLGLGLRSRAEDKDKPPRFFELRTYITHDGKMPDLHKRFREHTNRLFQKHGITLVGYWTPTEGDNAANTLVYMLAYPSREARDKSWKAFQADPEWQAAYKESHKNGPLVDKVISQYLQPTDYSPIK